MPAWRSRVAVLTVAVALLAGAAPSGLAAPAESDLRQAQKRALELQDLIDEAEADRQSIATRIEVADQLMVRQQDVVAQAGADLAHARSVYRSKLIAIYKSRRPDAVSLLLNARTIGDLLSRAVLLSRIADSDRRVVRDAAALADEAAHQQAVLEDLKAQDVALRSMQDSRLEELEDLLAEQDALVARLTEEERAALEARRAQSTTNRQQWRDSSIPVGTTFNLVGAAVADYPGTAWLIPDFRPTRFKVAGEAFTAKCSWYGNQFNGRPTSSGQIFNQDDFTVADNWHPFGTYLALQRGDRRIIVLVNDRGPFLWQDGGWTPHPIRKLDLSRASAYALGFSGVADVRIQPVVATP